MPACTSSPTAAGWSAPSRARWPAASTSSSCATRTPPTTSCWPPPRRARELCHAAGALFLLNDRPDLAAAGGADGVHVGQDDMPVDRARKLVGDDAIVGLSTHSMQQAQAGCRTGADYIAVGPVHATPTKEGRPAIGVEPIKYAAAHVSVPWFAIGGLDAGTSPRWSRRARGGSSSSARSPRPTTPRRRRARCVPPTALGRRSRKRAPQARARLARGVAPRGRRSRKRRPGAAPVAAPPPPEPPRRIGCAAATRAPRSATPPFARPRAARAGRAPAALVAAAVARRRCWRSPTSSPRLAGVDVEGEHPSAIGVLALRRAHVRSPPSGMWLRRYWAVLGFEALLGIIARLRGSLAARAPPTSCRRRGVRARSSAPPAGCSGSSIRVHGQAPGSAARSLDSGARYG